MTKQNLEKCLSSRMENNPSKTPTTSRSNSRTAFLLVSAGQEDGIGKLVRSKATNNLTKGTSKNVDEVWRMKTLVGWTSNGKPSQRVGQRVTSLRLKDVNLIE